MALEVSLTGSADLKRLAQLMKQASDSGLGREMAAGLRKISKPVQAAIKVEYEEGLPKQGGYANTFTRSIKWRTELRGAARQASFRLTLFGEGAHERRDIGALEAGRLRHPIYGRSRRTRRGARRGTRIRNPWSATSVRGGYFQRGTDQVADQVEKEMSTVLADYAARLIK